tara:strand:- start:1711 stop:2250 length:540 start_codon:yes stop_codon:yes gene_type:complete
VFLGLDISTSITGATLVDDVGQVMYCEAWDMRNKKYFPDLWSKANFVKDRLLDLKAMFVVKHIFVEQSLQAFRPGFSSAKTLLTLASFNGIVSYICQDELGIKPEFIGASTARKSNGIKIPRGEKAKKVVLDFVLDNEPDFVVEYTKQENPKPGSYDRADSLIIARAGYNLWKEKNSNS